MTTPHIITLSGPSLSGKTELSKILQRDYGFNSVVSVTTRPQRGQEKDGIDYHFISEQEYSNLSLIQKTNFNGFNYGVSEKEILGKKDAPILWVVAPGSINQIEQYCFKNDLNITKVFVTNPKEVLVQRLFSRLKEDKMADVGVYAKRLNSMLTIEQQWVEDAKNNIHGYDIVSMKFDETNTQEVVNQVLSKINPPSSTKKMRI